MREERKNSGTNIEGSVKLRSLLHEAGDKEEPWKKMKQEYVIRFVDHKIILIRGWGKCCGQNFQVTPL